MTRTLIPALALLLLAVPALAATNAPQPQVNTPDRTMTQNSRVELPAPPPQAPVPPAPPLQHVQLRGR